MEVDGKQIHLPLNLEILKWANETREILSHAKVPATVKFYNIYGTNCDTPHSVWYIFFFSPAGSHNFICQFLLSVWFYWENSKIFFLSDHGFSLCHVTQHLVSVD